MNALTKKRTRGNQEDSAHEKPYPKEKRNVSIKVQNPIPIVIGIKQKRLIKKKKRKRGGVRKNGFRLNRFPFNVLLLLNFAREYRFFHRWPLPSFRVPLPIEKKKCQGGKEMNDANIVQSVQKTQI